jgi:hypothetical protein
MAGCVIIVTQRASVPQKSNFNSPASIDCRLEFIEFAMAKLALIDEAWAMLHSLARNNRLSIADPSLSLWGRRRLETLRKAGAGKAEIVAALEKDINCLKENEAIVERMRQSGRASQVSVYDVQIRRMEADIWLNEETAR